MRQNGNAISGQQAQSVVVSDTGNIQALIKPIRGVQVILDRDVARLYGVATGALNRQV
ncbi:MAG: ORF6N domain-containing protein, partial [Kiritimatiellae bacterium]|nr:ORF6N domain-containing protein [Kiritimatiellia bacterium]